MGDKKRKIFLNCMARKAGMGTASKLTILKQIKKIFKFPTINASMNHALGFDFEYD